MSPLLHNVALELTNKCNLSCEMCWSQNPVLYPPREKGFMSFDLFKNIVDQLEEYRNTAHRRMTVCLDYGGESLLHPDFTQMLTYIGNKRTFRLRLITNGLLMNTPIIRLLNKYGVLVTISYHKVNPHQRKIIDDNITHLLSMRGYTRVNVAVVSKEDPKLVGQARAKYGHIVFEYPLMTEDLKYVDGLRKGDPFCKSPFHYMAVLWNGDVWPCCHLLSSDFPSLGNLNNGTINEIWDGEPYTNLRLDPNNYPCKTCELW
jgi:sulfatase maturation enzyme AslB (radical SAM superfamily)